MKTTNWKNETIRETPHNVDARQLYDKPEAQVMHIMLKPYEHLKPHKSPVDVIFFIIEGKPTVQVGDEQLELDKDMLVESPKNIVHCLYNHSDKPARILVIKTPKPTTKSRLL